MLRSLEEADRWVSLYHTQHSVRLTRHTIYSLFNITRMREKERERERERERVGGGQGEREDKHIVAKQIFFKCFLGFLVENSSDFSSYFFLFTVFIVQKRK